MRAWCQATVYDKGYFSSVIQEFQEVQVQTVRL